MRFVNVGIMAMIVTGFATQHLIRQSAKEFPSVTTAIMQDSTPKALTALSCISGQRIVIAVSPVQIPYVAGRILKRSGSMVPFFYTTVNPFNPRIPWVQMTVVDNTRIDDLTNEFRKTIGEVLDSVDLQKSLLTRTEQIIKPRISCETTFLKMTLEKPETFLPSDRVLVISFYSTFTGSPVVFTGYLSVTVMTGKNATDLAKRADESGKIMDEMKKLEPYVLVYNKMPDIDKLKQYAELARKLQVGLTPYIDAAGTVNYTSPGRSTDQWLANGGTMTTKEIFAAMDRLIGDMAEILFK